MRDGTLNGVGDDERWISPRGGCFALSRRGPSSQQHRSGTVLGSWWAFRFRYVMCSWVALLRAMHRL